MRAWWGLVFLVGACDEPAPATTPDAPAPSASTTAVRHAPQGSAAAAPASAEASPPPAPRLPAILESLRGRHPAVLDDPATHRLQLVVRWEQHGGTLQRESFRPDAEYVYPASAIKPIAAVAALRALRRRWPTMPAGGRGVRLARCLDAACTRRVGDVDVAETITATLRDSDNEGLAWLFDLVGRRALNEPFWTAGVRSLRFHHRMGETSEEGRSHAPMHLSWGPREAIATTPPAPPLPRHPIEATDVGAQHMRSRAVRLEGPMSFASKNFLSLDDAQRVLVALVAPPLGDVDLGLDDGDRRALIGAMSAPPTRPGAHRPLTPGLERVDGSESLLQVQKSGRAYGFTFVNAALRTSSGSWAFVAASIYANPNRIVNDDAYGYGQTALPFLADLGELIADALLDQRSGEKK